MRYQRRESEANYSTSVELVGYVGSSEKREFEFSVVKAGNCYEVFTRQRYGKNSVSNWESINFTIHPSCMTVGAYETLRMLLIIRMGGDDSLKHSYEFDYKFKQFWSALQIQKQYS